MKAVCRVVTVVNIFRKTIVHKAKPTNTIIIMYLRPTITVGIIQDITTDMDMEDTIHIIHLPIIPLISGHQLLEDIILIADGMLVLGYRLDMDHHIMVMAMDTIHFIALLIMAMGLHLDMDMLRVITMDITMAFTDLNFMLQM
jgi:hypothetical protein